MAALKGTLIAESLKPDAAVDVQLKVPRISRRDVGDVTAGQPRTWTFIECERERDEVGEQSLHATTTTAVLVRSSSSV